MIEVKDLTKYYGDFCAVDKINFSVKKGEILGLLGPNGAGKTTTLRVLTCYMAATSGTIDVKDYNIKDNPLEIKNLIGYLPESAPLYNDMLTYDYLNFVAEVRDIPPEKRKNRIHELAKICSLKEVMHKAINELSKGYKQRVGLAHAMMSDPEILILDEPTIGLDPNQIVEIRELIKNIGKQKTVILSSHNLGEVEATCDRVVIINRGKIVADSTVDELKKKKAKEYFVNLSFLKASFKDLEKKFMELEEITNVREVSQAKDIISISLTCNVKSDIRAEIYDQIKKSDWTLLEFTQQSMSLETIFRELTKDSS